MPTLKNLTSLVRKKEGEQGYEIRAVKKGPRSPALQFIKKELKGKRPQDDIKVTMVLKLIAEMGPPRNREQFAPEGDGIWAIKTGQVRIYCFYHEGRLLLLTNGAIKKQNKANPDDLKKARRLRKEFLKNVQK